MVHLPLKPNTIREPLMLSRKEVTQMKKATITALMAKNPILSSVPDSQRRKAFEFLVGQMAGISDKAALDGGKHAQTLASAIETIWKQWGEEKKPPKKETTPLAITVVTENGRSPSQGDKRSHYECYWHDRLVITDLFGQQSFVGPKALQETLEKRRQEQRAVRMIFYSGLPKPRTDGSCSNCRSTKTFVTCSSTDMGDRKVVKREDCNSTMQFPDWFSASIRTRPRLSISIW